MLTREPLLGTRGQVHIEGPSDDEAERVERKVLDEAARLELVFTAFDRSSELFELRTTGSTTSDDLLEVVAIAERWRDLSGRAFDPYCQPIFDAWEQAAAADRVPEQGKLDELVAMLDTPQVATINLNAIAKGWIVERSLHAGRQDSAGFDSGWLSLGGDITHTGDGAVVVGIEDPARPYDNAGPRARIELSNESLATSGGGRRWWTIAGKRWSHVLDPRTGWPVDQFASVTVVAARAADADALATALLVLDEETGVALLEDHGAVGFAVRQDGSVRSTSARFESVTPG